MIICIEILICLTMFEKKVQNYMEKEDHFYTDEGHQAIFQRFVRHTPDIYCPSSKRVAELCLNPHCKNSLRCKQIKCQSCGPQVHDRCLLSVSLADITNLINKKTEEWKEKIQNVFVNEEQLIENIRRSRSDFVQKFLRLKMGENDFKLINKIYEDRDYSALTGEQANEMCKELQKKEAVDSSESGKIKQYTKEWENHIKEISRLRQTIFLTHKIIQKPIELPIKRTGRANSRPNPTTSQPENTSDLYLKFKDFIQGTPQITSNPSSSQLDSEVLKMKGSVSIDLAYLNQIFKNPKGYKLLYRASNHAFSAQTFHQNCNNIRDTLTLVRNQFNKTFGGFTHYKWNQVNNGSVNDAGMNSFLLQMDLHQKMVPVDDNKLIECKPTSGPTFGGGYDIYLSDYCNSNADSMTYFPTTYNLEGQGKYTRKQDSLTAFCGAKKGCKFRVIEYEVYQVLWK